MWKNSKYLYANDDFWLPLHLNFSAFMLSKLWENKHNVALINAETQEELTYKELAEEAMSLAISLVRIGVRKGDVLAICSENRQEFYTTVLAIMAAGGVTTPLNFGYSKDELKHAMSISKPKYIFCSPRAYKNHAETLADLPYVKHLIVFGNEIHKGVMLCKDLVKDGNIGGTISFDRFQCVDGEKDDTVLLLYSSGTTGLAKGVMLTHVNLLAMSVQPDNSQVIPNVFMGIPWYHAMGLVGTLSHLIAGRTIIYVTRFEPGFYLRTIEKYQVAQITVVPPILVSIIKFPSDHDLRSVSVVYCGAAPLRADTINAVSARFPNASTVLQGYGMTETTLGVIRSYFSFKPKAGSVGKVVRGTIAKIVDIETRKPLSSFQEGEICVKGPLIMKGYVGKDRRDDFDEEGFFKTGDIAYYDEEAYVFIVGRLKELIKYKGYQVPPAEIEAVLLQHQDVQDAGVVGVPDEAAGEVPLAFVVLKPGASVKEDDIKQFVAKKLSNPKHLRGGVQFVSEIPKNPSGKILRNRLQKMVKLRKSKL